MVEKKGPRFCEWTTDDLSAWIKYLSQLQASPDKLKEPLSHDVVCIAGITNCTTDLIDANYLTCASLIIIIIIV